MLVRPGNKGSRKSIRKVAAARGSCHEWKQECLDVMSAFLNAVAAEKFQT